MADESAAQPSLNLGGVISEQLTESIKKMDLLTVLQKMVATTPEDEESEEIRDKLRGVLKQYEDMDPADKERFTNQIKEGLVQKLSMRLKEGAQSIKLDGLEDAIRDAVVYRLYLVGIGVFLFILLLGMHFTCIFITEHDVHLGRTR
ncbi:hypothetical protein O3G_MSEX003780 [Manduca sexta]|uniref:Uncharacterized protein n=1 Tax=Manduca sexta TaxID=7130 RepID=A0A921YTD5_MANSE|nr:hypothetical protein O3G_MSEX003780 [Manduca sexta]KAG6445213.1 hypothetical protein O3G_MSEX003780 [Manduca sexta]